MDTPDSSYHQKLCNSQSDQKLSSLYSSPGEDSGFGSAHSAEHGSLSQELQDSEGLDKPRSFDGKGGTLFMKGNNVRLDIPPGALTEKIEISLSIMNPLEKGCPESFKVPRITPILQCEPDGLQFHRPVKIVVPHCGLIQPDDAHDVEVYTRCRKGENPTWKRDDEASASAILEETTISINITHFSNIDVFVKNGNAVIGKLLRALPMVYKLSEPDDDVILMLWMCNSEDEVYNQIWHEQTSDDKIPLCGSYRQYLLKQSGNSVTVAYQNRSAHFSADDEEEIAFEELWFGNRGAATIKLTLKSNRNVSRVKLQGTLTAQQDGNTKLKFDFQKMVSDFFQPHRGGDGTFCKEIDGQTPTKSTNLDMPYQLGRELSDCLDLNTVSHNWKSLADELGYTGKAIENIAFRERYPTHSMLTDACKSGKLRNIEQLKSILNKLQRIDAVNIIIKFFETKNAAHSTTETPTAGCQTTEPMDTTSEVISSSNISESKDCLLPDNSRDFPDKEYSVYPPTPTRNNSVLSTKSSEQGDSEDSGFLSPGFDLPDERVTYFQ